MKKLIIGVVALGLAFGIGTSVVANSYEDGLPGFREMLPFMQQMHPDWSEDELETMYRTCHGDGSNGGGMMRQLID